MPFAYKVLGQSAPSATTDTDVYTVPASTEAIVSVLATNRGSSGTIRVAVRPDGATLANEHYIAYDESVGANERLELKGLTLDATDVVTVYASSADFSVGIFGQEIT